MVTGVADGVKFTFRNQVMRLRRTVVAAEPEVPIPIYRMLEATQIFGLESAACDVPTVIVPVPLVAV